MKQIDLAKLEKNEAFKKRYYSETRWWLNLSMVAPMLLIFIGIAGLIYLRQNQMLLMVYSIPYVLLFLSGTLLLRGIKHYLYQASNLKKDAYMVCVAHKIAERNGNVYAIFYTDSRRHHANSIVHLSTKLDVDKLVTQHQKDASKRAIEIENDQKDEFFYLKAFPVNEVDKRNVDWREKGLFTILFINTKKMVVVRKIDVQSK